MTEMTIEKARETKTTKGALFVELAKSQLEWIKDAPATTSAQKEAARLILEDRARADAKNSAPLADSLPPAAPEVPHPAAFPPAPKAVPDGIMMSHLLEIAQKLDRLAALVGTLSANALENSEAIGLMTGYLHQFSESSKKESAKSSRAPAPGHLAAGDKPLKQEHATRFVLEHKDGKVRVSFWDDDKPKLKFAVLTNTMSAQDWAKMLPWVNVQAWKPASVLEWATAFPNAKKQNEIEFRCNLFYTDSDNLTANGNPYKDLQRVQPDDF